MAKPRTDLAGMKFNRLTVICYNEEASRNKKGAYWNCKCECGNTCIVEGSKLKNGGTKSCGCLQKENSKRKKYKDITGERYGRLVVVALAGRRGDKGGMFWRCRCDCGNEKIISGSDLRKGAIRSCGCLRDEKAKERLKEQWQDDDFREMQREKGSKMLKEKWKDEEYRKMISENTSETLKRLWQDEDYRKIQSGYSSEKLKKLWENDNYREIKHNQLSEQMIERWADEEYREAHSGENSPVYNHNLTQEERENSRKIEGYDAWAKQVKADANYTCDCCGKRGGKLNSHHLDGYHWCEERRIDITNGVCLCKECHDEFHKKYGKGNNTEAQYIEFKQQRQQKQ